jgi:hypothetical protein
VISIVAGNVAYEGAIFWGSLSIMVAMIVAAVAAYGGDRFLVPVLDRIVGQARQIGGAVGAAGPPKSGGS